MGWTRRRWLLDAADEDVALNGDAVGAVPGALEVRRDDSEGDAALGDELGGLVVDGAGVLGKRLAAALHEGFNPVQTVLQVLLQFADLHG